MSKSLMCHVVAGFPDTEACLQLISGLQRLGITAIEVQIPFSDPIADGETIMRANDVALEGGTTTAKSFDLIQQARQQGVDTDIYIMSYMQKILHYGLEAFCQQAADCSVKGLIVPDLPYDSPEFDSLHDLLRGKLEIVPVVSPGMSDSRLQAILAFQPKAVYVTSQRGITGNKYSPADQLEQIVSNIRQHSEAKIMIGFGISTPADVSDALSMGDTAVVGSAIVQAVRDSGIDGAIAYVKSLMAD